MHTLLLELVAGGAEEVPVRARAQALLNTVRRVHWGTENARLLPDLVADRTRVGRCFSPIAIRSRPYPGARQRVLAHRATAGVLRARAN